MSEEEEHEKYGKKKEDGEVMDGSNIEVENQCNKSVDFAGGEQIKLSMHFNHPWFSFDYVCKFCIEVTCSWMRD